MSQEFGNSSDLKLAFQRGMRQLWARSIWRWVRKIAADANGVALATRLGVEPGNVSRGNEGSLSPDRFLMILATFHKDYADLDPRPSNMALATAGYMSSIHRYACGKQGTAGDSSIPQISVWEFCQLVALLQNPWIAAFEAWKREESSKAKARLDQQTQRVRADAERLGNQLQELREDHVLIFERGPREPVTEENLIRIRQEWYLAYAASKNAIAGTTPNWPPEELSP